MCGLHLGELYFSYSHCVEMYLSVILSLYVPSICILTQSLRRKLSLLARGISSITEMLKSGVVGAIDMYRLHGQSISLPSFTSLCAWFPFGRCFEILRHCCPERGSFPVSDHFTSAAFIEVQECSVMFLSGSEAIFGIVLI